MSIFNIHMISKNRLLICLVFALSLMFSCNPYGRNIVFLYKVDDYPVDQLAWSPTSRQLVFTSYSGSLNASSIYILDVETKDVELFMKTNHGRLGALGWTPDETELIFFANSSNEYDNGIWKAKIGSQNVPQPYMNGQVAFGWSSTNQIAVTTGEQKGPVVIYVQDPQTQEEKAVFRVPEGSLNSPLSWSGDGAKLAFSLRPGESYRRIDLFIADLATGEVQKITNEGMNDSPSLSPHGNMVAYVKGDFSGSSPSYSLHIMNADGTCDTEIPGLMKKTGHSPAWSPDGKWLAFVGTGNRIFLLDLYAAFGEDFLSKGLSC